MTDTDPLWYKDAIIYQIHVRAFHDSVGDGVGDFRGLRAAARLPPGPRRHRDLAAAVLPVAAQGRRLRHRRLHRGQPAVRHAQGLPRVPRRGPPPRASASSPNWSSTTRPTSTRGSSARAAPRRAARSATSTSGATRRTSTPTRASSSRTSSASNWTYDPVAEQYYWHRFYTHQPDLNFDNPAVWDALTPILDFWMEMGVDGMRLDAIPYLFEREGTNCENLPETHAYPEAAPQAHGREVPRPHVPGRGEPVAGRRHRVLRRRRRVPHGVPLPGHAAAVHGAAPGRPVSRSSTSWSRRRRSRRTASGACSCATTTS